MSRFGHRATEPVTQIVDLSKYASRPECDRLEVGAIHVIQAACSMFAINFGSTAMENVLHDVRQVRHAPIMLWYRNTIKGKKEVVS